MATDAEEKQDQLTRAALLRSGILRRIVMSWAKEKKTKVPKLVSDPELQVCMNQVLDMLLLADEESTVNALNNKEMRQNFLKGMHIIAGTRAWEGIHGCEMIHGLKKDTTTKESRLPPGVQLECFMHDLKTTLGDVAVLMYDDDPLQELNEKPEEKTSRMKLAVQTALKDDGEMYKIDKTLVEMVAKTLIASHLSILTAASIGMEENSTEEAQKLLKDLIKSTVKENEDQ
jgi:hypothetical protein